MHRLLPIHVRWLTHGPNRCPGETWEARQVWFLNNGIGLTSLRNYCGDLVARCLEFHYMKWPYRLGRHVKGKEVADLGCGRSLHGIGFLTMGARSYTGLDPVIDLDKDAFKDTRIARTENMKAIGWTPRRIAKRVPRIRYLPCSIDDLPPDEVWDVLAMHNVTEHLMQIREVFTAIHEHLHPDGRLIFRHPNYYAWGGHHMAPRFVAEICASDAEQRRYMDWAHLIHDPTWPNTILKRQNRIRLDQLREIVEEHFEIEEWEPELSTEAEGAARLTPQILARHPDYSEEELLTQAVFVVARPRPSR